MREKREEICGRRRADEGESSERGGTRGEQRREDEMRGKEKKRHGGRAMAGGKRGSCLLTHPAIQCHQHITSPTYIIQTSIRLHHAFEYTICSIIHCVFRRIGRTHKMTIGQFARMTGNDIQCICDLLKDRLQALQP